MPLRATLGCIPSGIEGVRATLRVMVKTCRDFLKPPMNDLDKINSLLLVRVTAQRAVQSCREKDYWAEAAAIHRFVRDEIRYVRDILDKETLQFPDKTLLLKSGDCDDKSMLFCAMAHCIGYPSRFCAVAVNDEPDFSHVSAQCLVDGFGWINAECIPIDENGAKADFGWFPPDATQVMTAHVSH
jgi:transglutaminase-like putative cysteine protease